MLEAGELKPMRLPTRTGAYLDGCQLTGVMRHLAETTRPAG